MRVSLPIRQTQQVHSARVMPCIFPSSESGKNPVSLRLWSSRAVDQWAEVDAVGNAAELSTAS
jgi:hypothetical protein